jgi:hypothetical protein
MSRDTVENTRNFSIFFLRQNNKLIPETVSYGNNVVWSRNGDEVARINYDISTIIDSSFIELNYKARLRGEIEWRSITQKLQLDTVPCKFGGKRWYFRCNLSKNGVYCGRRVAKLYTFGDYFGCRYCADLTYESCNESKKMRGFPWRVLTDQWKADEIYKTIKRTHYKGKPTRKYRKCLDLWGTPDIAYLADKQLQEQL